MNELDELVYTSLRPREIRLVSIYPGSGFDELLCCLSVADLDKAIISYEALSYVWGDAKEFSKINCNNSHTEISKCGSGTRRLDVFSNEATHHVNVSQNLIKALLQLRDSHDCRTFWIDAICINQNDLQERSDQVLLMTIIYKRADRVVTWLGDEDENTAKAIGCLNSLANFKDLPDTEHAPKGLDAEIGLRPWLSENEDEFFPHDHWIALKHLLLNRPWFRRAWVYQEIVMASKAIVQCGGHIIGWDVLYAACGVIHARNVYTGDARGGTGDVSYIVGRVLSMGERREVLLGQSNRQGPEPRDSANSNRIFERLLCEFRSAEATDPRDKVYALLGVAEVENDTLLKPNYSSSIRKVYINVARYLLAGDGQPNLQYLSYVQESNKDYDLPSWVPDWSKPFIMHTVVDSNINFQAGINSQSPAVSFVPAMNDEDDCQILLTVRGVCILTIKVLAQLSDLQMHADRMNSFPDPYPTTNQTYLEAYSSLFDPLHLQDCGPPSERRNGNFWDHILAYESRRNDTVTSDQSLRYTHDQLSATVPVLFKLGYKSDRIAYQRMLFISSTGFMGLAPKGALPGDKVILLLGARVPFAIRKSKDGRWKLLGECFVHGIMLGEAMVGLKNEKVEDFILE